MMIKSLATVAVMLALAAPAWTQEQEKKGDGFESGMEQWQFWHPESYELYGPHTWGDWGGFDGGGFDWKGGCPWQGGGWGNWKQGRSWGGKPRGERKTEKAQQPSAPPLVICFLAR